MRNRPKIIAHRGWSAKAPENSLSAFRKAMEFGADGIELDVHFSKDGQLAVFHDSTLDRTTDGTGHISDHTMDELRAVDIGSRFSPEFAGEKIPTLDEVLQCIREYGWDGMINIHLKTHGNDYPGIESEVFRCVDRYGFVDRLVVSSSNHKSLVKMRDISRRVQTAILYSRLVMHEPWVYAKHVGCTTIHPNFKVIGGDDVAGAHAAGVLVNVWTINDVHHAREAAKNGVDGIMTDRLDDIHEAVASLSFLEGDEAPGR